MLTSRGFWLSVLTMAPPVSWPSSLRRSVAMAPPPAASGREQTLQRCPASRGSSASSLHRAGAPLGARRPARPVAPALHLEHEDSGRTPEARLGQAICASEVSVRAGVVVLGRRSRRQIKFSFDDRARSGSASERRQRAEPRIRGCVSGLAAAWCASTLLCSCTAALVHSRSATASSRPPLASLFCTAAAMF